MAYPIARRSFLPFVRLFAKPIEGMEHIPDNRPVIIAANHLGLFDPLFVGAIYVQKTKKKLRFLVDTGNLFWHFLGYVLQHWTNTIAVKKDRPAEAVDKAVECLRIGESVAVFPEGVVNRSPSLLTGKTGAVRMSLKSRSPILPVGIENTNVKLLTIIGRRLVRRHEGITIRFGQPYQPDGRVDDVEVVRRLTAELMTKIANLSGKVLSSTHAA